MSLSDEERNLLLLITQAGRPVAMSDFFDQSNSHPRPDIHAPDDDPVRLAWTNGQLALYGASVSLWEKELVRVVYPANGERPDLVEATDAGRDALT